MNNNFHHDDDFIVSQHIDIQSMNTDILQIPSEQNRYHAVVRHTLTLKTGESYSAIGHCVPDGKISSINTLDKAQEKAFKKSFRLASQASGKVYDSAWQIDSPQSSKSNTSHSFIVSSDSTDKSKMNGGGNKPITEKQINLIKDIARKNSIDIEALMKEKFGKILYDLNGSEANEIIRELKKSKY